MNEKPKVSFLDQLIASAVIPLSPARHPNQVRAGLFGALVGQAVRLGVLGWWLRDAIVWAHPHKLYAAIVFYFLWTIPSVLNDVTVGVNRTSWYCKRDEPRWGATAKCLECGEAHGLIPIRTHTYPAGLTSPATPPPWLSTPIAVSRAAPCDHDHIKNENGQLTCSDCGFSCPVPEPVLCRTCGHDRNCHSPSGCRERIGDDACACARFERISQ